MPDVTTCSFAECNNTRQARGFCNGHYKQARSGRELKPLIRKVKYGLPLRERLEASRSIDPTNGCWIWQKALNENGYGTSSFSGKTGLAHRVAYEEFVGPIPEGLLIDHKCGTKACINPAHLRVVTKKQNGEHRVADKPRNATGFSGVYKQTLANTWRAEVTHNGVTHRAGTHPTPELAAEAAKALRLRLFTHNDRDRV